VGFSESKNARLRVLVFALNYYPEPTGSAPYMTRLAEHLAAANEVTVITGYPHYPSWTFQWVPSDRSSNPRIFRYRHFVPARPTTSGRAIYEVSWLASAARGVMPHESYDAVIALIPTLAGGLLAHLAGRRYRCPVGIVIHDLIGPGARQTGVASDRTARLISSLELAIARRASTVAVLGEEFRPYLVSSGVDESRIMRFRNWARLGVAVDGVAETRKRLGWSSTGFVCLHAGNMGQKQGLENIVNAAQLLQGGAIRFVLAGDGNDRPNLVAQAKRLRLDNLAFVPVQPTGQYESMLASANVLLMNQRAAVKEMSMPSKLTAYFAAGRPIAAAIDPMSAAAREIERAEAGVTVSPGDPRALADAIERLRSSPEERVRLGNNGRRYAESVLRADADLEDYDAFVSRLVDRKAEVATA